MKVALALNRSHGSEPVKHRPRFKGTDLVRLSASWLLMSIFSAGHDPLRSPIHARNRHRPERNQIDPGHELGKKRWQKLPVPAKQTNQHDSNTKIEYVVRERFGALDE